MKIISKFLNTHIVQESNTKSSVFSYFQVLVPYLQEMPKTAFPLTLDTDIIH